MNSSKNLWKKETEKKLAKDIEAVKYMKCSAKTMSGYRDIFDEVLRFVINDHKQGKNPENNVGALIVGKNWLSLEKLDVKDVVVLFTVQIVCNTGMMALNYVHNANFFSSMHNTTSQSTNTSKASKAPSTQKPTKQQKLQPTESSNGEEDEIQEPVAEREPIQLRPRRQTMLHFYSE